MLGTIFAGCVSLKTTMWAVPTVLHLIGIVVTLIQLKRE